MQRFTALFAALTMIGCGGQAAIAHQATTPLAFDEASPQNPYRASAPEVVVVMEIEEIADAIVPVVHVEGLPEAPWST